MRKFIIFIAVLLSVQNYIYAQSDEILHESEPEKAYIEYSILLKENPAAENYFNMCKITYYLNDSKAAKSYCNSALNKIDEQKEPDFELRSNVLSMMGNIYSNTYRNKDITLEYYKQALDLKEKKTQTDKYELAKLYMNMGFAYYNSGLTDYALNSYNKALELCKDETDKKYNIIKAGVYNDLALIERRNQNYDKSFEYLEKSTDELENAQEYINHKMLAAVYENMARYYEYNKKDKKTAIKYYKKTAEENNKIPPSNLYTVFYKNYAGLVMQECQERLKDYPYDISTNIDIGYLLSGIDDKQAEQYFKKAISINPDKAYTYLEIARAYAAKYIDTNNKLYLIKIKEYSSLTIKKAPYTPEIYLGLGLINIYINSYNQADKYFEKYIKYSNDEAIANCDVASLYWYFGTNDKTVKRTIKYINRAIKLNPEIDNKYKIMLTAAYRKTGQTNKAEELTKKNNFNDII